MNEAEKKQTELILEFKKQLAEETKFFIAFKFEKLMKESEDLQAKSVEMEEWQASFDAEQKKQF